MTDGVCWISETSDTASLSVERVEGGYLFTICEEPSGEALAHVTLSDDRVRRLLEAIAPALP
jgi:hypothetical protein